MRLRLLLHLALMLDDPRRGVGFGAKAPYRGRMTVWDVDLDTE
jgi:hypothetical protein